MSITLNAQVNHIVISAIYGGGGNAGAKYKYDFIELFNPTSGDITLTNWAVQYGSATGTAKWASKKAITATIPSGHYFLIQLATGNATIGSDIPTPDSIGTINMGAANGKVALTSDTVPLTGANVSGGSLVDLVGFGTSNGFETKAAPAGSNTKCIIRINGGCTDTDDNSKDFILDSTTYVPRNSSSPANNCALLPVILSSFTASFVNNQVALKWATTTEINFNNFEIEKSFDKSNFTSIATIPASKVISGSTYQFKDEVSIGNVYYRLKMIDNQGAIKYSAITTVNKLIGTISAYPNPVVNSLIVNHPKAIGTTTIKILSIEGKIMATKQIEIGATQTTFDVNKLKNGNYILSFEDGVSSNTIHIVK